MSYIITIDGPAASGKTSVSRGLAKKLGCKWVSTGAFYRGLSYLVHLNNTDVKNEEAVAKLIHSADWQIELQSEKTAVFVDGKDVTNEILREEVGAIASQISQYPKVRSNLLEVQRNCANQGDMVAEGRDCGSVVFPNAQVKIYLTAKSQSRAERRAQEEGALTKDILAQQKKRDDLDRKRKHAPLQVPTGAHVVDTSELSLDQVVDFVEKIVRQVL